MTAGEPRASEAARGPSMAARGTLCSAAGAREALWAAAGLLVVLLVHKMASGLHPVVAEIGFAAVVGYQLYVPMWLIQRAGELPESHGIHAHGALLGPIAALRARIVRGRRARGAGPLPRGLSEWLSRYGRHAAFRPAAFWPDVRRAFFTAVITFVPFAAVYYGFHVWLAEDQGRSVAFSLTLPPDAWRIVLVNVLLVAVPEEVFYRGFLETRLERLWPTTRWLIVPLSRTVFITSAIFAAGHFIGEWNPMRFGPFFPAFVFSMLARRGRGLLGAVGYHASSNIFSAILHASLRFVY